MPSNKQPSGYAKGKHPNSLKNLQSGYIAPAVDEHPAPPKDWTTKRGAYRRGVWDGRQTHKRLSAGLHERRRALWDAQRQLEGVDDVEEGEVEVLADRLAREQRRDRRNTREGR